MIEMVVAAILGALLQHSLPAVFDFVKYARRKSLLGKWHSCWQPENDSSGKWVSEIVTIRPSLGRLRLKNAGNSDGYQWEGVGKLIDNKHVIGRWHSVRPGATSAGTFTLTICPQGCWMIGSFVGPNDKGVIMMGAFVLGRSPADIEAAQTRISTMFKHAGRPRTLSAAGEGVRSFE